MAIDLRSSSLRPGRDRHEDVNPMESIANLSDVMLVLACGLMIALITAYNVNIGIGGTQEVQVQGDVTEVTDINEITGDLQQGGSSYNELGTVYQDPTTGKLYMLSQDLGTTTASEAAGTTTASEAAGTTTASEAAGTAAASSTEDVQGSTTQEGAGSSTASAGE